MNCFHFSVSLGYKTTARSRTYRIYLLWIAFIFQYLWDTKQQDRRVLKRPAVVNCFHFSVSLGYKTTLEVNEASGDVLWIAFIFQYLWDTKQLINSLSASEFSCELLSFFSIFGIQNNSFIESILVATVVNCFHFSVSLGYKTTLNLYTRTLNQLWIAFIFQYLWDTKQLIILSQKNIISCELLSFFSIFGIQNNQLGWVHQLKIVVNCFHFSVSLGYKTTSNAKK